MSCYCSNTPGQVGQLTVESATPLYTGFRGCSRGDALHQAETLRHHIVGDKTLFNQTLVFACADNSQT